MSEHEGIPKSPEIINPVLVQEHDYFIYEKNRINNDLANISNPEEKINYLLNEFQIALNIIEILKEKNEKKYSLIERLNSFSPGLLAAEEVIKFIKTQFYAVNTIISASEADNGASTVLNGEKILDFTEQLLLISYLQDGGHFIKRKPHQTEKNIQDLICLLLNKDYESLKTKVRVINEIKSRRITKGQVVHKVKNLKNIKDIFLTIGDKTTFDKIENRIKEFEKIAAS